MELNEFLCHIKHNNLGIDIFGSCKCYYTGTVGTFKHATIKGKIGKWKIEKIEPLSQTLSIYLKEIKMQTIAPDKDKQCTIYDYLGGEK